MAPIIGGLAQKAVLWVFRSGQICTNWHEKRRALLSTSPRILDDNNVSWREGKDVRHPFLTPFSSRYTGCMLLCPVRGCHLALRREKRQWVCARGHSFDVARSGYINLLQPQERKSKRAGDTTEAIAGRRRLHERGVTAPLLQAVAEAITASAADVVLDAGCGEGFYLGSLALQTGFDAHGIDISIPAIDAAARRYPECQWVVANADRTLPYADHSFNLGLSINGRMNAGEFRRVLQDDGRLLVAIPAPDDLIELRGKGRDRAQRTVETFAPEFTLIRQRRVSTMADLGAAAVQDVLHSIYRPRRSQPMEAMRVTFSLDLLLFRTATDSRFRGTRGQTCRSSFTAVRDNVSK